MKNSVLLSLLFFVTLFYMPLSAQIERNVSGFHSLEVHNAIHVNISQGDFKLEIEAKDPSGVITEVKEGVLIISMEKKSDEDIIIIHIHMPEIKEMELHGASHANFLTSFNSDMVEIDMHGASVAQIKLNCNKLNLELHGASKLSIDGKAKIAAIELSGASKIDAENLLVEEMFIEAHSASKAEVNAGTLKVEASGASKIVYAKGNILSSEELSGAASVKMKG